MTSVEYAPSRKYFVDPGNQRWHRPSHLLRRFAEQPMLRRSEFNAWMSLVSQTQKSASAIGKSALPPNIGHSCERPLRAKAVIHTRIHSPFSLNFFAPLRQQDSQHHPAQKTAVSTASWKPSRKVGSCM